MNTSTPHHHHHFNLTHISGTLSPLTPDLNHGLIPVAFFGILSFITSTTLFLLLSYRIVQWNRNSRHVNQFIVLIWNLLLADIQQSMAFLLNAKWLVEDQIHVGTTSCWAQGWFVSTGDLASGMWSFAIGLHTFAVVIFGYRLSNTKFTIGVVMIWTFVYAMAVTGVALHPSDIYVRAVAWCWVNIKYARLRLWLHYFWIFSFEFGTVLVYSVLILALRWRIQSNFYRSEEQTRYATQAAKLMTAYPIVYVLCTLPLATLRMYQETTTRKRVSETWFCFAGAMITSNGWLDVMLYCLTRRIMLFSDEPPTTDNGIESFGTPWMKRGVFGTQTTCEHVPASYSLSRTWKHRSKDSDMISMVDKPYRRQPTNDLIGHVTIATERTVRVTSAPITEEERHALEHEYNVNKRAQELMSSDSGSSGKSEDETLRGTSPSSMEYEIDSLEFNTKPAGY